MGYEYGYNGPNGYGAPNGYSVPNGYDPHQGDDEYDEYDDDTYEGGTHPAVKWGLIFGIVMTVASLAPFILLFVRFPMYAGNPIFGIMTVLQNPASGAVLPFVLLLMVAGLTTLTSLFLAGFLTTRETGTIRSGTVSGVLAVLASNAVSTVVILTWVWLQPRPAVSQTSPLLQIFAGIGGLLDFGCGLVGAVVPAAAIAALGASLARLIWGPPEA